jgi:hypothetical protein
MPRSGRPDIIPFLIFSAAQLFYIYTLAPGLLWGDSANFQRLAFTLDFQSEYAYAEHRLWVFLAHPFAYGEPQQAAYRVNLFTSVWAAIGVAFVFALLRHVTRSGGAALTGSAALLVSHSFWLNAVRAEVYSLNLACLAAALFCFFHPRAGRAHYLLGGGALALGVINHAMMLIPSVVLIVWLSFRCHHRRLARVELISALVGFLLPCLASRLLPLRGTGSIDMVPFHYIPRPDVAIREGVKLIFYCGLQFPGPALLLAMSGVSDWRRYRSLSVCLAAICLLNVGLILNQDLADKYVFYMFIYFAGAIWVGLGTPIATEWMDRRCRIPRRVCAGFLGAGVLFAPIAIYHEAPFLLPRLSVTADRLGIREIPGRPALRFFLDPVSRNYDGAFRYANAVFEQLPSHALLIADYTVAQPLLYEKQLDGRRTDVQVAVVAAEDQVEFVRGLAWNGPLFLALTEPYYDIEGLRREYEIRPEGLIYRLWPKAHAYVSAGTP